MPRGKIRSLPERYPYNPIHHVEEVIGNPDGSRTVLTNAKYPSGRPVRFYTFREDAGLCAITDRGEIAIELGAERYGYGWGFWDDDYGYWRERCFSDAQIEHWRALNYIFKTKFGEGPAKAMSIIAGGRNMDMALAKIIGATRNFIVSADRGIYIGDVAPRG